MPPPADGSAPSCGRRFGRDCCRAGRRRRAGCPGSVLRQQNCSSKNRTPLPPSGWAGGAADAPVRPRLRRWSAQVWSRHNTSCGCRNDVFGVKGVVRNFFTPLKYLQISRWPGSTRSPRQRAIARRKDESRGGAETRRRSEPLRVSAPPRERFFAGRFAPLGGRVEPGHGEGGWVESVQTVVRTSVTAPSPCVRTLALRTPPRGGRGKFFAGWVTASPPRSCLGGCL
jgi:hypothetical protein